MSPPARHPWALVLLTGWILVPHGEARAQDAARVHLRWTVPEGAGCADAAEMRDRVEDRLGRPAFSRETDHAGFVVAGTIETQGRNVHRVEIALLSPSGSEIGVRVLEAPDGSCAGLARSLSIIISLLVTQHQERIVLYEPPEEPPSLAAEGPTASGPPTTEQSPPSLTLSVELGGSLRGLALPGAAKGLRHAVGLGLSSVPVSLLLEAQVVPSYRYGSEIEANLWTWSAGASLCPRLYERDRVAAVTCAGVMVGQLHVEGVNLDVRRSAKQLRVDLATRLGVRVRLAGPLWVSLLAMVDVPFVQNDLAWGPQDDERVLHEAAPISLGAGLSVGVFFPPS